MYKNTVTRNIAVEKVVSELLQPASQLTPQKNKRSRRLTESKDRNNNFLSSPMPNTPSPQRQFRQRSYTVPHSIVLASQHYEQHKQELGSRVQKWLVCSVCLDTVKPFKMIEDGLETDNADKFCAMKQCENGHLICEKCLDRLLADAALKNTEQ